MSVCFLILSFSPSTFCAIFVIVARQVNDVVNAWHRRDLAGLLELSRDLVRHLHRARDSRVLFHLSHHRGVRHVSHRLLNFSQYFSLPQCLSLLHAWQIFNEPSVAESEVVHNLLWLLGTGITPFVRRQLHVSRSRSRGARRRGSAVN